MSKMGMRMASGALAGLVWIAAVPAQGQMDSARLQALQQEGRAKGWTFTVGKNPATEHTLSELCGLVEPADWRSKGRFITLPAGRLQAVLLPSYYDWRTNNACTAIKNQGNCGSCWAFATVGVLESAIKIKEGLDVNLSEQWLVNCNQDGWGCGGGWFAHQYHQCAGGSTDPYGHSGAVLESAVPYTGTDSACNGPYAHPYCLNSWAYIGSDSGIPSTEAIKQAILTYGPVSVGVYANDAFQAYTGGVFNNNENKSINHAVILVGWDDSLGVWIMRNSWGTGWGESGYMRIVYGCCQIGYAACFIEYAPRDNLQIAPADGLSSLGPEGGPFTPACQIYTLRNSGAQTLSWSATHTQNWVTVDPAGGVLATGATREVSVCLNTNANRLQGTFGDTVVFSNITTGVSQTRAVTLRAGLTDYFTELFDTHVNDLDNQTFTFTTNGSLSAYAVCRGSASAFPTDPAGGTALTLADDGYTLITLSGGKQVRLYGTAYGSFYVCANGNLSFGSGDATYTEALSAHFGKLRIAALFDDLNPTAGGSVSWKQLADRVAVTWQNVPEYGQSNAQSFQIELFFNGMLRITLLAIAATDGLIGLSRGLGQPADYVASDFTAYPLCNPGYGGAQVTIQPPAAVAAGAQWRVDGGSWRNSGTTATGLVEGVHTVSYNDIAGYDKPVDQNVVVVANQTVVTNGIYTLRALTGMLQVTISPPGAIGAGAQWRVDGGIWRDSGSVATGLVQGAHPVNYKAIGGYTAPADQTVNIFSNQTTVTNGVYIAAPQIPDAVDAPTLNWITGGDASWFPQNQITHDGEDAAQSGDIGDYGWSWLQTSVAGPGFLRFWWKVSSEPYYDFLRFYVDGYEQPGALSGESGWAQKTYSLGAGTHTLTWSYEKDVSLAYGYDAGWVDQVSFGSQLPYSGTPAAIPGTVEAENFDLGGQNAAYNDTTTANEGGQYRPTESVDIAADAGAGNGYEVGWTKAGEWLEYTVNVASNGNNYMAEVRVAAVGSGASLRLECDGADLTGPLNVPNTGGWAAYTVVSQTGVALTAGQHVLRLYLIANGSSGYVASIDWFRIGSPAPGPAQEPYNAGRTPWPLPGAVEAENYDYGGSGVAYNDTTTANEGGVYRSADSVDIAGNAGASNGFVVGWTKAGEWLEYTVNVASNGSNYILETRWAAVGAGGSFRLECDGADVTGSLGVPNTGGWFAYQTVSKTGVALTAGQHVLRMYLLANGSSGYVGNFDCLRIAAPLPPPPQSPYNVGSVPWPIPGAVEAENYDYGGAGVAYSDTTTANEGGLYRPTDSVDITSYATASNGYLVGWTKAGEWLEYTLNVASAGQYTVEARVAISGAGGTFHLEVDGTNATGAMSVPNSGGWFTWTTARKTGVSLPAGVHVLRLALDSNGYYGFVGSFDRLRIIAEAPAPAPTLPGKLEAEDFDAGGEGVGYHDTTSANEGGAYRTSEGVDLFATATASNGYCVGAAKAGEWLAYTVNVTAGGSYAISLRVAAAGAGGTFHVEVDGINVTGALTVPNTGGWLTWTVVTSPAVALTAGQHTLRLVLDSNGVYGFTGNFDYLRVAGTSSPAPSGLKSAASSAGSTVAGAVLPVEVLTSDDTPEQAEGRAAADGDTNTVWTGRAGSAGWWVALAYAEMLELRAVEVDVAAGSATNIAILGSADAEQWSELKDALTNGPVRLQYLWVIIKNDGAGAAPRIRDIRLEAVPVGAGAALIR